MIGADSSIAVTPPLTVREQLLMKLLTAPPEVLARVAATLENKREATAPTDRKLLTLAAAAAILGVSRQTVLRMTHDGRLPVVETRAGRYRVPSYALTELLQGGIASARNREVPHE